MPVYFVQPVELFQVRSYERREKCPFAWRQLTIPSHGKLLQSLEETAGRQRHSKPGSQCVGDPRDSREQVNRKATDVKKKTGSSQGLGGDLERFAVTQEACENCLVGKQRQNR